MLFINLTVVLLIGQALAANWSTYPSVPKTASINGFADPIYDLLPKCAQECVELDTDITPCPYWDTGCFCVMANWSGVVAECFAESCSGGDVASASSLAESLCYSVGANTWILPASISTELINAQGTYYEASAAYGTGEAYNPETDSTATETAESTSETGQSNTTTGSSSAATTTSSSGSSGSNPSKALFGLILVGAFAPIALMF